jgi:hypothetical protein
MSLMRETDEVGAHQWRLAQTNRFRRFCQAQGADPMTVMSGDDEIDLSPICDKHGRIVPEQEDIDVARADSAAT